MIATGVVYNVMVNKRKFILLAIAIFAAFGLIFFYFSRQGSENEPILPFQSEVEVKTRANLDQALPGSSQDSGPIFTTPSSFFGFAIGGEAEKVLDEPSADPFQAFFDTLRAISSSRAPAFGELSFPSQSTASPAPGKSSEIKISEKELFEFGYPPDYLKILADFNKLMIQEGFLGQNEIFKLDSFDSVNKLQDKIGEFLTKLDTGDSNGDLVSNTYTAESAERFKKLYRETLPRLWKEELTRKKSGLESALPFIFFALYQKELARQKSEKISAFWFGELFKIINKVQANHTISPQCYREGGSSNFTRGSQRTPAEQCCNCGYVRRRRRWRYVEDCGHRGENCNIQVGCLNYACPNLPAIWDPESGICGCFI